MGGAVIKAHPGPDHDAFVPVLQRPEYTFWLEQCCGMTFAHCEVWVPWTPGVKRALCADVEKVKANHGGDIRIVVPDGDAKLAKMIRMIGFHYEETHSDAQGLNSYIYLSPGKNNEGRRDGKSIPEAHDDDNSEG